MNIVDKVGCGNAFLSAYLHARAEKKHPDERLRYAIAAGAMASTYAGAFTSMTPEMIHAFMETAAVKV